MTTNAKKSLQQNAEKNVESGKVSTNSMRNLILISTLVNQISLTLQN